MQNVIVEMMRKPQYTKVFFKLLEKKEVFVPEFFGFFKKRENVNLLGYITNDSVRLRKDEMKYADSVNLVEKTVNVNYLEKQSILSAYKDLEILLWSNLTNGVEDVDFWKEFFENQYKNDTEVVGGLNPLYLAPDDVEKITVTKEKKNKVVKQEGTSEKTAKLIIKITEDLVKDSIFSNPFRGTTVNRNEDDFEMKQFCGRRAIPNKDSINKYMSDLNAYSKRKIEEMKLFRGNALNAVGKRHRRHRQEEEEEMREAYLPNHLIDFNKKQLHAFKGEVNGHDCKNGLSAFVEVRT